MRVAERGRGLEGAGLEKNSTLRQLLVHSSFPTRGLQDEIGALLARNAAAARQREARKAADIERIVASVYEREKQQALLRRHTRRIIARVAHSQERTANLGSVLMHLRAENARKAAAYPPRPAPPYPWSH